MNINNSLENTYKTTAQQQQQQQQQQQHSNSTPTAQQQQQHSNRTATICRDHRYCALTVNALDTTISIALYSMGPQPKIGF
tara:strand:+ start:644 stop:886 length:243 start_codon:yes stop_codon:yes gene_type:complete